MTAFACLILKHKNIAQKRKDQRGRLVQVSNIKHYRLDHNCVLYLDTVWHI